MAWPASARCLCSGSTARIWHSSPGWVWNARRERDAPRDRVGGKRLIDWSCMFQWFVHVESSLIDQKIEETDTAEMRWNVFRANVVAWPRKKEPFCLVFHSNLRRVQSRRSGLFFFFPKRDTTLETHVYELILASTMN